MRNLKANLLELIRRTSAELPEDVVRVITSAAAQEQAGTNAQYAMNIIVQNIDLARAKSAPLCQDTGSILFFVKAPKGFDQLAFQKAACTAVAEATAKGYLRQNSVDSITGKNTGDNLGPGSPSFHYEQHRGSRLDLRLILKGGGCENVGAQYSLPDTRIGANRDLAGVRKAILDAVIQAQGKGCGPGILGVCIGGDRATGYLHSKEQLLRTLDDVNPHPTLAALEQDIVATANKLNIGPMGFGGATTLLGCKLGALNRLPASFFVSISYMCWAYRRQGFVLNDAGKIAEWLY
jgi:fumarate hydratase class I